MAKLNYSILKKKAEETGLNSELAKFGFNLGGNGENLWYYRSRKEYIDTLTFWLQNSRAGIEVVVDVYKARHTGYSGNGTFNDDFVNDRNIYSDLWINDDELTPMGAVWYVGTEKDLLESLEGLLEGIKDHALPWFESIQTDEDIWKAVSVRIKEEKAGIELKRKLFDIDAH